MTQNIVTVNVSKERNAPFTQNIKIRTKTNRQEKSIERCFSLVEGKVAVELVKYSEIFKHSYIFLVFEYSQNINYLINAGLQPA